MKRSFLSFHLVAVAGSSSTTATSSKLTPLMSYQNSYRGGRGWGRGRRSYSDSPVGEGEDHPHQLVAGDSHFRQVHNANRGFRPSYGMKDFSDSQSSPSNNTYRPKYYNPRPQPARFRTPNGPHPRAPPSQHQQPHWQPLPQYGVNQQPYRQPLPQYGVNQKFRPQWQPQQLHRQQQQFKPGPPKGWDYRKWEFAKPEPPLEWERFTVLSYNILADYLAVAHRQQLYFHIPGYMMDWEWRKRNIAFEIGLWSADILCLQEVDRFQDLKEELGLRGYSGIWKMRTGDPVDGCAIFWRDSRFKLLHEESVEFNTLGLRDNVAQICVFESLHPCNDSGAAVPASSLKRGKRVVVCNIHVLFNPKRGDIKLGQVRVLLSRAHTVAKRWDDAPVVVCGDFNSTPKSPLYNFITDQKLDLSELPRNQVSGQTTAEIRPWRPSNPHPGPQSADNSSQALPTTIHQLRTENSDYSVSAQNQNSAIESSGNGTHGDPTLSNSLSPVLKEGLESMKFESADINKQLRENNTEISGGNFEDESTTSESCNGLKDTPVALNDVAASSGSVSMDGNLDFCLLGVNTESLPSDEIIEGRNGNDQPTSLPEEVESFEQCASLGDQGVCPPGSEILNDIPDVDPDNLVVDQSNYDSSAWTPGEIEAATGTSGCMMMEHPLNLCSAYGEVEDCYGTRDSTGEPSVTSYHKRFFGTVDYIWHSEGLQTSRVLATIPKQAMTWTQGFPTKKWGSDHIALVSELAFRDEISCPIVEIKSEDGS